MALRISAASLRWGYQSASGMLKSVSLRAAAESVVALQAEYPQQWKLIASALPCASAPSSVPAVVHASLLTEPGAPQLVAQDLLAAALLPAQTGPPVVRGGLASAQLVAANVQLAAAGYVRAQMIPPVLGLVADKLGGGLVAVPAFVAATCVADAGAAASVCMSGRILAAVHDAAHASVSDSAFVADFAFVVEAAAVAADAAALDSVVVAAPASRQNVGAVGRVPLERDVALRT